MAKLRCGAAEASNKTHGRVTSCCNTNASATVLSGRPYTPRREAWRTPLGSGRARAQPAGCGATAARAMFFLLTVRDSIRVAAPILLHAWGVVLADEIDARYANRVLPGIGLVVCLADILHCGDAVLPPGDGAAHGDGAWRGVAGAVHGTRSSLAATAATCWAGGPAVHVPCCLFEEAARLRKRCSLQSRGRVAADGTGSRAHFPCAATASSQRDNVTRAVTLCPLRVQHCALSLHESLLAQ